MNTKKIIYAAAVMLAGGVVTSCSDNYLDLAPVTSVTNNTVVETVDGAKLGMIGICQRSRTLLKSRQHSIILRG